MALARELEAVRMHAQALRQQLATLSDQASEVAGESRERLRAAEVQIQVQPRILAF